MLRSRGHELAVSHTAGEHATQLALVAAGLGAAVIPRLGREPLPAGVRIVRIRPALRRYVYAVWRTDTSRLKRFQPLSARFNPLPPSLGGPLPDPHLVGGLRRGTVTMGV